jgi:hypothetical protein
VKAARTGWPHRRRPGGAGGVEQALGHVGAHLAGLDQRPQAAQVSALITASPAW